LSLNYQNQTRAFHLPIEAYASQLKQTADALRDVGHPILDRQLVLNLLNSINPRLANTADIIANMRPLPTFTEAVNMLRLKELRLANDNKVASNTALTASTTAACTSASCRSTSSPASQPRGNGGRGKRKGKGGSSNGGGGGRKQQQQQTGQGSQGGARGGPQPAGPWVCFNPWAWGPQQQWRPPMAHFPQAHTAFAPPQVSTPAPAPAGYPAPGPSMMAHGTRRVSSPPSTRWRSSATALGSSTLERHLICPPTTVYFYPVFPIRRPSSQSAMEIL